MAELMVKELITALGPFPRDISAKLQANGLPPVTPKGVEKWSERDSISTDRLLDLLLLGRAMKTPINIMKFIRKGTREATSHRQGSAVRRSR